MFRDRRVRNSAIVMPMILVLGMLSLFSAISGIGDDSNQKVTVVGSDNKFVKLLREKKFQVQNIKDLNAGKELIKQGKARLVLDFPADADAAYDTGKPVKIDGYLDPQQQTGQIALAKTEEAFATRGAEFASKVLAQKGVTKDELAPFTVQKQEVKVGSAEASDFLISLLPYFIVIWAFYGGMASASDMVSGEKEKMTLETLLIAPVGRSQIALGKFLALGTICFLSSTSVLMGFIIAGVSGSSMFSKMFPHGLGMGAEQIGAIFLVLLPTVAFFASMLIAVSTYAKNAREAQSYLTLVSFVVLMPAIFGQFIGLTDLGSSLWVRFVPVLNTSLAVRESLQGKTNATGIAITVLMGAVLAFISIRIAVALFKREQVLTRI